MSHSVADLRPLHVAAIALLLAFAFLGMRGIWDPDEGRYTNVALVMLDSGDWLSPMRNGETGHWTKPPMTYWLVASSVALFGQTPWGARLPIVLAFLACAWCARGISHALAPGKGDRAALVFVTMVAPFGAAQLITTDFLLAAACAAAMLAYVRSRFGAHPDPRWLLAMWAAFGVAFLIKGPPGWLPLLAIAAFGACVPAIGVGRWRWHVAGALLAIGIALPWYLAVVARHDGLLAYFVGAEVLDRIASDRFDRNGEWYGWAKVYGPMLLLGTMPWTPALLRWVRTWPSALAAWRSPALRHAQGGQVLLLLWIALPLLVFCVARSRLPLYVLPLFVPIAVAIAVHGRLAWPRWPWMAAWIGALLAARFVVAQATPLQDASAWADGIRARAGMVAKVVFVEDTPRWGLHLHLDAHVERRTRAAHEESRFGRRFDGPLGALFDRGSLESVVFVARIADWNDIRDHIASHGFDAQPLGAPYAGRRIFRVRPMR